MARFRCKRSPNRERGATFLEAAVTIPFLVLLAGFMLDSALLVQRYSILYRVTYEGARVAGELAKLEMTSVNSASDAVYLGGPHYELHTKIRTLIQDQARWLPGAVNVVTERAESVVVGGETVADVVSVQLTSFYKPLMFPVGGFNVRAQVNGAYLYQSEES